MTLALGIALAWLGLAIVVAQWEAERRQRLASDACAHCRSGECEGCCFAGGEEEDGDDLP